MNTIMDPFEKYKEEYWQADEKGKGEILNTMVELVDMHKKSIIRRFRRMQLSDTVVKQAISVKQGRPIVYGIDVTLASELAYSDTLGKIIFPRYLSYFLLVFFFRIRKIRCFLPLRYRKRIF